jgi:hypothetical protein
MKHTLTFLAARLLAPSLVAVAPDSTSKRSLSASTAAATAN